MAKGKHVADWTYDAVVAECRAPYRGYHKELRKRHTAYYNQRTKQQSKKHPFAARKREYAFADKWQKLAATLPDDSWHVHHLSGGSSQTLLISLLAPALQARRDLSWLLSPSGPMPSVGNRPHADFEYSIGFGLLHELPRTTGIDFFVSGSEGVLCVEAKYMEEGLGRCSCPRRATGECATRVLDRPYWDVAHEVFGLKGPSPPQSCRLSFTYQAVRNVAAALELTGLRRRAAFGLLYDDRNPYFRQTGQWPGWPEVLRTTLDAYTTSLTSGPSRGRS